jgi:hypothetical protein
LIAALRRARASVSIHAAQPCGVLATKLQNALSNGPKLNGAAAASGETTFSETPVALRNAAS